MSMGKRYVHAGWQSCFVGSLCSTASKGLKIWQNGIKCFNILSTEVQEGRRIKGWQMHNALSWYYSLDLGGFTVESCVPFHLWQRPTQHIQMRRLLKSPGVLYDLLKNIFHFWWEDGLLIACPRSSCSYLSLRHRQWLQGAHVFLSPCVVDLDQECKEVDVTSHLHSLFFFKNHPCVPCWGRFLLTLLLLSSSRWIL